MAPRKTAPQVIVAAPAIEEVLVDEVVLSDEESVHSEAEEVKKVVEDKKVKKARAAPKKAAKKQVEEVSGSGSETEELKPEKPKVKKERKPKAEKPVAEEEHSHFEVSSDESEGKAKKVRKPRVAANLDSVMEALENEDVQKAKKLLAQFIKKHGNGEKKKRVTADGEKRPLNNYQQFVKDKMAEIKEEHPEMSAKDRMKAATQAWNAQKSA